MLEGSELLAPVVPSGYATGGYVGVFRITGDAAEIVDAYAARRAGRVPVIHDEYSVDDRPVIQVRWDEAGGVKFTMTATTDDAGDWYALLEIGND